MRGPQKLPHMSVWKIADFWASKWPHPCPDIADFRSLKADPCLGHCRYEVSVRSHIIVGGQQAVECIR
jgi:hypothetical protein